MPHRIEAVNKKSPSTLGSIENWRYNVCPALWTYSAMAFLRRWLVTSPQKVFSPSPLMPTSMGDQRVLPLPSALSSFLRVTFDDCILGVSLVVDGTRAQSFPSDFAWFNMEAFDHYTVCSAFRSFPPFGFQFSSFLPCVTRFFAIIQGSGRI